MLLDSQAVLTLTKSIVPVCDEAGGVKAGCWAVDLTGPSGASAPYVPCCPLLLWSACRVTCSGVIGPGEICSDNMSKSDSEIVVL